MSKKGFVVVRGGVSGAGRHISLAFAKAGYNIAADFADVGSSYRGPYLVEESAPYGVGCIWRQANPGSLEDLKETIRQAEDAFGEKLAIYINNDGVIDGKRLDSLTQPEYDELISMHINSMLNCAKAAADAMEDGGVVITTVAVMPPPFQTGDVDFEFELDLYRAFTKSLAKTYKSKNVRFVTLISAPLNYPPDRDPPEGVEVPNHAQFVLSFEPPPAPEEEPDDFLKLIVNVAQTPKINGQVISHNLQF